jgi:hypothetical protein
MLTITFNRSGAWSLVDSSQASGKGFSFFCLNLLIPSNGYCQGPCQRLQILSGATLIELFL